MLKIKFNRPVYVSGGHGAVYVTGQVCNKEDVSEHALSFEDAYTVIPEDKETVVFAKDPKTSVARVTKTKVTLVAVGEEEN